MRWLALAVVAGAFIAGCGGGGGGNGGSSSPPELHSLGGTVTGLHGTGLVLANSSGGNLTVPQGAGTFTFATSVASGTSFNVTVATQPTGPSQTCVVAHGSGTVAGTDVTNVAVTCTDNSFTVGGTVTGLVAAGLTLTLDLGGGVTQNIAVPAAGPYNFTFPNPVTSGLHYTVSVATAPATPPHGCGVAHASGTVGSANVTDVAVGCQTAVEQLVVLGDTNLFLFSTFIDPSTGAIALSSGAPTLVSLPNTNLTMDPSRHFIYTDILGYRIDPSNGAPISIAMPFISGSGLITVPSGKFAYALTSVSAWSFDRDLATGVLTLLSPGPSEVLTLDPGPILNVVQFIDASSSFAYVRLDYAGCSCYTLGGFAIDSVTGAVTANVPGVLPFLQHSRSFGMATGAGAIEPQGRYLLFASGLTAQAIIETFSIDATSGSLTKVSTVPRPSAGTLTALAIHPNGKFVYVSDGASLWGYSLDAAGALTPIGVLALNAVADVPGSSQGSSQRGVMTFDPSAQYLYVANRAAKSIAGIAVDANTGSMALVPGSPLVFAFDIQAMVASWIP